MSQVGDRVLKPFLQGCSAVSSPDANASENCCEPGLVVKVIPQLATLLDWMVHYVNLGAYSALSRLTQALQPWVKNLPPVPTIPPAGLMRGGMALAVITSLLIVF